MSPGHKEIYRQWELGLLLRFNLKLQSLSKTLK
jgi:hypothetical protein